MANLQALRSELQKPDLSGLSNEAAAAKLNSDVARVELVPGSFLDERGVYAVLATVIGEEAATTAIYSLRAAASTPGPLALAVEWLRGNVGVPAAGVDFGLAETHAKVDALVPAIIPANGAAALKAYGTRSISRAVSVYGSPVSAADVATARS